MARTFDPAWGNNGQHRAETLEKGRVIYDMYMSGMTMREAAETSGFGCSPETARYYAEQYAKENNLSLRMTKSRKARLQRKAAKDAVNRINLEQHLENTEDIEEFYDAGRISYRTYHVLRMANIYTLRELESTPFETLKGLKGMGPKSLEEACNLKRVY